MAIEDRRTQLLDSALHVLARDGYQALTIEAIAREAGVTRPVVYSAYDGLEPLLEALLDRTQARARNQVLTVLATAGEPDDVDAWLIHGIGGLIDVAQADPDTWRPILGLTPGAPSAVDDRIAGTRETLRLLVVEALTVGLRRRGGPELDVPVASHLLIAAIEEILRLALEEPPRYKRDRLLGTVEALLAAAPGSP